MRHMHRYEISVHAVVMLVYNNIYSFHDRIQYNNIVDNIIYGPRIFITLFSVFLIALYMQVVGEKNI